MRVKVGFFLLVLLLKAFSIEAQELIPMGTWRSHFNYEQTTLVEKTTSKVFAAASHGLMYFDQEDGSINKLSKVDGLSDVGISALAYNSDSEYLTIGYQSGNVDIITSEGIQNLPILFNSDVTEIKEINHVSFYAGNMNLSTDFGLLVLTAENKIKEAYQNLGENGEVIAVRNSVVMDDVLYLATEDGVISGSLTNGDNLQDFNNWTRYAGSLVYNTDMVSIAMSNQKVFAASATALYQLFESNWTDLAIVLEAGESIKNIKEGVENLLITTNQRVLIMNNSEAISTLDAPSDAVINDIFQEGASIFWYADDLSGLSKLENGSVEHIVLAGPLNGIVKLKEQAGDIYALPELAIDYTLPASNGKGYSVFKSGNWTTKTPSDLDGFVNISDVLVLNDIELISSFGKGILNTDKAIDYTNSPLQEVELGTGNTLVSGLTIDQSDNIWVANFDAYSLYQWNGIDDWQPFDFGSSAAAEPTSIAINENNQAWMTLGLQNGQGVLAYDIEAEISRYITATATSLPSNQVNDLAFGKDDEIWFATSKGLAYFPYSFGIIEDQTIDVTLPIFEDRILFEDKEVLSLAIDGGNRMWVGTQDGLWLFDENVSNLIEHFTSENSPLPSNTVIDLSIHPETGELFVATDQGVVSYRTNATEGLETHQNVKIFPNPVLPNFEGWVGLSGLANDVNIKITSVSGQLVKTVNASGGGASWDVRDYSGRRVATGVYLVFSSSRDGSETFVGKIAVID
ncbi:MAG: hypothetical protein R8N23_02615 [Reichenbachiella sp.]|uniref:type IX secretion system anionic LPS delivery protein PorZ n=1 Tax=Reichenbachiella sp. TaxID=2184521 RepID=UPI002966D2B0|nr:hypothetical protein [Reichenbachiella sp.]MDW3208734.1 hypothetical protein [Reichenbachiella sp.]